MAAYYCTTTSLASFDAAVAANVISIVSEKVRQEKGDPQREPFGSQPALTQAPHEPLVAVGRGIRKPADHLHSLENAPIVTTKQAKMADTKGNYISVNNSPSPHESLSQRYGVGSR